MVEREKQDKTNGSEVSRTIEQRQIAAPRTCDACMRTSLFFLARRVAWRGASTPHFRETPELAYCLYVVTCPAVQLQYDKRSANTMCV